MTAGVEEIARGQGSRIVEPHRSIVRDPSAWTELWAMHAGPEAPLPPVDFETQMVAAVFAGTRPSAGFEVEITGLRRERNALAVVVQERGPARGMVGAALTTTPFHIVSLPRYDGQVRFSGKESGQPRGQAPSSTGLSPSLAGALAYLAGPFSGLTILLAETSSRFVTFHAWQAIVGLGGLGLLVVILFVSAFLALLVSPAAFTVLYRIAAVGGALWIAAWMLCVAGAMSGRMWNLPLAGRYARRRASIGPGDGGEAGRGWNTGRTTVGRLLGRR